MWLIGTSLTCAVRPKGSKDRECAVTVVVLQLISDFFTTAPTERTRFSVIRLSACASRDAPALVV